MARNTPKCRHRLIRKAISISGKGKFVHAKHRPPPARRATVVRRSLHTLAQRLICKRALIEESRQNGEDGDRRHYAARRTAVDQPAHEIGSHLYPLGRRSVLLELETFLVLVEQHHRAG